MAEVTSPEQLKQLVEAGNAQRETFSAQECGAVVAAPTQVPVVDATSADQPQRQLPIDTINKSIQREVTAIKRYVQGN